MYLDLVHNEVGLLYYMHQYYPKLSLPYLGLYNDVGLFIHAQNAKSFSWSYLIPMYIMRLDCYSKCPHSTKSFSLPYLLPVHMMRLDIIDAHNTKSFNKILPYLDLIHHEDGVLY